MTVYVVATDSFMSGWGEAPGRSLIAAACETSEQVDRALARFNERPEFKRVRFNFRLPRTRAGDHLSIVTPQANPVWFQ